MSRLPKTLTPFYLILAAMPRVYPTAKRVIALSQIKNLPSA